MVLSFLVWQEDSGSLLFRRFVLLFSWEWPSPGGYRLLSNKESLAAKWGKHIGLEVDVCVYPEPVSLLITNSGEVRVVWRSAREGLDARVWAPTAQQLLLASESWCSGDPVRQEEGRIILEATRGEQAGKRW